MRLALLVVGACGAASPPPLHGTASGPADDAPYAALFDEGRTWTFRAKRTSESSRELVGSFTCSAHHRVQRGETTSIRIDCTDPPGDDITSGSEVARVGGVFVRTRQGLWHFPDDPPGDPLAPETRLRERPWHGDTCATQAHRGSPIGVIWCFRAGLGLVSGVLVATGEGWVETSFDLASEPRSDADER